VHCPRGNTLIGGFRVSMQKSSGQVVAMMKKDEVSFCLVVLSDVCLKVGATECARSMSTLVAL
jgi:hypothetical protein